MFSETPVRTFIVGASDIPQYSRVTLSSGLLIASAATANTSIGTIDRIGKAGKNVAVKLWNPTRHMIASAAITVGAACTVAASGKIVAGAGGKLIALDSAAADGEVIEVALAEPT